MNISSTLAVIYVPELNDTWLQQCIDHCGRRGYHWSVVVGDVDKVGEVLKVGVVKIVVVARAEHFDPYWMPRIETVGEHTRRITREVVDAARTIRPATPGPVVAAEERPTDPARPAGKHRRRPNLRRQD